MIVVPTRYITHITPRIGEQKLTKKILLPRTHSLTMNTEIISKFDNLFDIDLIVYNVTEYLSLGESALNKRWFKIWCLTRQYNPIIRSIADGPVAHEMMLLGASIKDMEYHYVKTLIDARKYNILNTRISKLTPLSIHRVESLGDSSLNKMVQSSLLSLKIQPHYYESLILSSGHKLLRDFILRDEKLALMCCRHEISNLITSKYYRHEEIMTKLFIAMKYSPDNVAPETFTSLSMVKAIIHCNRNMYDKETASIVINYFGYDAITHYFRNVSGFRKQDDLDSCIIKNAKMNAEQKRQVYNMLNYFELSDVDAIKFELKYSDYSEASIKWNPNDLFNVLMNGSNYDRTAFLNNTCYNIELLHHVSLLLSHDGSKKAKIIEEKLKGKLMYVIHNHGQYALALINDINKVNSWVLYSLFKRNYFDDILNRPDFTRETVKMIIVAFDKYDKESEIKYQLIDVLENY